MIQPPLAFAFLPIRKPAGPTSHDVVDVVRRLLPREIRVGHTGTLDPFATGLLVLALGKATKFADDVHLLDKRYRATLRLGEATDTLDPTGAFLDRAPVPAFDDARLRELEAQFTGPILQVPPAYSAKRVKGKRSYELARKQLPVELSPSKVTIHKLSIERVDDLTLLCDLTCSTGTYVRALGRDLAEALGTVGYLLELERVAVGPLQAEDAPLLDGLDAEHLAQAILPVGSLLPQWPAIELPRAAYSYFVDGRAFRMRGEFPARFLGQMNRTDGKPAAIYKCEYNEALGEIQPRLQCYKLEE